MAPSVAFGATSPASGGGNLWRKFAAIACAIFAAVLSPARAEERITDFDVAIEVEQDGDIFVTEKIAVSAEGYQIQRGIFRDLPRFFLKGARKLPYVYDIKSVTRDGDTEPYAIEKDGNAYRLRIGDADVYIANGPHLYEIAYEVKNQVRYFDDYDEIYWNATGNYWAFPIDHARAVVTLPGGAPATRTAGYTGYLGDADKFFTYSFANGRHDFAATRPLAPGQGMTVAVGFAKGLVDPPSAGDARDEWWAENASTIVLGAAFLLLGGYFLVMFERIGRDPPKGPVFARYEPPEGHSPAAVHYVYHRGLSGHDALIASIVNLAIGKRVAIDVDKNRKLTVLTKRPGGGGDQRFSDAEEALEARLMTGGDGEFSFGKTYNPTLTSAYEQFRKSLAKSYGADYFRWNTPWLILAVACGAGAVILAANLALSWTSLHTLVVVGLAAMTLAGAYFLPAPTPKGQETRTAIEGFRLYLKTAEEMHLNQVEVGSDAPPPMTVERYERFLPYAIALGVEKPWTEHFEALMPKEAADYRPTWAHGNYGGGRSLAGLNSALVSSMASGVSSSLPQSSSSSGSGGGGSSGGGGGGGGGGGW
ncbi:MAG: hypothetical protein A3E78_09000 [Alphaproteobacteria bacterium RIFCSPHIGHO2_12_FULL_63_12]|nr:MAG: hypothetical protein A3E78_09000 [Alphaproteobacteria bacterium RIFCSPHIGHO2_12_FULL_63_12]